MGEMTNSPRLAGQGEPRKHNKTAAKSSRSFDPSRCDESCGACWVTFCGDLRCCEADHVGTLRRELAEALEAGGDGG